MQTYTITVHQEPHYDPTAYERQALEIAGEAWRGAMQDTTRRHLWTIGTGNRAEAHQVALTVGDETPDSGHSVYLGEFKLSWTRKDCERFILEALRREPVIHWNGEP